MTQEIFRYSCAGILTRMIFNLCSPNDSSIQSHVSASLRCTKSAELQPMQPMLV